MNMMFNATEHVEIGCLSSRWDLFGKILIANRGEIARRIQRTARKLGLLTVAIYSDADRNAAHVQEADEAVFVGPSPARESYLRGDLIIAAALSTGAEAIHPGYGFLSENSTFAEEAITAGLIWVGPAPQTIRSMGDKVSARNLMQEAAVPVNPGGPVQSADDAMALADKIGFPLMIKPAAGGGGIGMKVVHDKLEMWSVCERTSEVAARFFGDGSLLVERFLDQARHVEIQIFGLANGEVVALGERDCSVQRRFQKVVEETPSPGVGAELRTRMVAASVAGAKRLDYRGAGTMEYLVKGDEFVFLELNARLQVEHPVTEMVTGVDLVEAQLLTAAGEPAALANLPSPEGHAIEFRVYAEDPVKFFPAPGTIVHWREPDGAGLRIDAGYRLGDTVTSFYDPLLAKLCVHGRNRVEALERASTALGSFEIEGPKTNLPFLAELLANPSFACGAYDTGLISRMRP